MLQTGCNGENCNKNLLRFVDHLPEASLDAFKCFHASGKGFGREIAVFIVFIIPEINPRIEQDNHLIGAIDVYPFNQMIHVWMIRN